MASHQLTFSTGSLSPGCSEGLEPVTSLNSSWLSSVELIRNPSIETSRATPVKSSVTIQLRGVNSIKSGPGDFSAAVTGRNKQKTRKRVNDLMIMGTLRRGNSILTGPAAFY